MNKDVNLLKAELKAIFKELLKYVSSKSFTASEEEVENVLKYVEEKTIFYDKINKLEKEISRLNPNSKASVDEECKPIIREILNYEEEHMKVFKKLAEDLNSNITNLKTKQKFYTAYHTSAFELRGDRFDAKQ